MHYVNLIPMIPTSINIKKKKFTGENDSFKITTSAIFIPTSAMAIQTAKAREGDSFCMAFEKKTMFARPKTT